MKTLLVVNGGDAPGINTFIARYQALATQNGDTALGADGGFVGVLNGDIRSLLVADVRRMEGLGGTMIASTREPALSADDARVRLQQVLHRYDIDNIVLFGGNGSLTHIPPLLQQWNIPHIGIPTTIDNDIPGTEMTLGFDSACNYAYQAIDGVTATAYALPGRVFMVETLGGDTGYIALQVAYGAGAHAVLVPEYDYDEQWLGERLKQALQRENYALVVLSEGVKSIPQMESLIPSLTGIRLRYVKLGHAQRGSHVSHADRLLAHDFAYAAYEALKSGEKAGVTVITDNQVGIASADAVRRDLPPPDSARYQYVNGLR